MSGWGILSFSGTAIETGAKNASSASFGLASWMMGSLSALYLHCLVSNFLSLSPRPLTRLSAYLMFGFGSLRSLVAADLVFEVSDMVLSFLSTCPVNSCFSESIQPVTCFGTWFYKHHVSSERHRYRGQHSRRGGVTASCV